MDKICFVCETPYQLINSIRISGLKDYKPCYKVLYISRNFRSSDSVIKNICELDLFNKVYIYDYNRIGRGYLSRLKELILPSQYLYSLLENSEGLAVNYTKIFLPVYLYFGTALIRINKSADIVFYEDGLASYSIKSYAENFSITRRLVFLLTGTRRNLITPKSLYLNCPSLLNSCFSDLNIFKIPEVNDNHKEIIERIFDSNNDFQYQSKKIVYISQPIEDEKDYRNLQKRNMIFDLFYNNFKDDVILRLHPREKNNDNGKLKTESSCNWELLCHSVFCDDTIFITSYSTAAFVPKLIFNKEPYVFFIYPIYEYPQNLINNISRIIEDFKRIYDMPEKIVIIKDPTELIENLRSIML